MIKNKAIAKFNDSKFNPAYLLMIFSFVLRLTTFAGMSEGDDLYYALLARRFSQGDFSASFIFDLRWVVFAPVSLFYKIFGVNDITSIAPTIIYGVLSVWLAYQIVNEESDKFTATLASLLYLAFPIVLIYGNFLQVAPSLEFFTLLSVYSFQKGQKTEQIRWFILGGLSIGAIFFARVTGLFIAPLISLYLIYKKGFNKKSMIWIGCAALSSLILPAIQGLIYYSIHGDFFHYIAISKRAVSYQNSMNDVDPKDLFFYVRTLFLKKDFANWRMYGLNGWFFTPILLFALVKSCIKRGGKELLFIIWYLSYFCFKIGRAHV